MEGSWIPDAVRHMNEPVRIGTSGWNYDLLSSTQPRDVRRLASVVSANTPACCISRTALSPCGALNGRVPVPRNHNSGSALPRGVNPAIQHGNHVRSPFDGQSSTRAEVSLDVDQQKRIIRIHEHRIHRCCPCARRSREAIRQPANGDEPVRPPLVREGTEHGFVLEVRSAKPVPISLLP